MTLFIDQSGRPGAITANLFTISRCDGNVGDTSVAGDPTVTQVTYAGASPAAPTAARLFELVNTNFGTPIVLTALPGGIDPYSGLDITGNGHTFIDSSSGFNVIRVVYDVNQCTGAGITTFDTSGGRITTPNSVILYHELSHAFRGANGTKQPNDEIPAETDENVLRTALGLCLRNINNHDADCGAPASTCGGTTDDCGVGDGSTNGCFIVTATTGSSESVEVVRLRQLRDRVSATSGLGAQLIDVIYGEYFQFSPQVAARLQHDVVAREVVLQVVVRPLLAWYTLAGALALEQADHKAVSQAAQDVMSACPRYLSASVVALLETIRSGEALPPDAPRMLVNFAPKVRAAMRLRSASWAIIDPLVRAWRSAAQGLDIEGVVEEVSQWLATAPLEEVAPPSDPELLDQELGVLASFFDFKPGAQAQLGGRLAVIWPGATGALRRHGFI